MQRRLLTLAALSAAVLSAVALSACGSSASTTTHPASAPPRTVTRTVTRTPATSPTHPTATSPANANTNTGGGPSSNTQAGVPQCVARTMRLSFLGGQGATGHGLLAFALRNRSRATCRTGGYPGVLFLDGAGRGLPTTPHHTTDDFFGHTKLRELSVAPGAIVSFRLGVSHVGHGGSDAGCVTARGLQVIPPNDTHALRIKVTGIAECGGTVSVSPLQTGRSALG